MVSFSGYFVVHTADNIECPAEHLKSLLKLFSILKIKIIYDETIDNEYVPEAVGIIYIKCVKIIGCSLDNQKIEDFITNFFTDVVFQYIVFLIIKSN